MVTYVIHCLSVRAHYLQVKHKNMQEYIYTYIYIYIYIFLNCLNISHWEEYHQTMQNIFFRLFLLLFTVYRSTIQYYMLQIVQTWA